MWGAIAELLAKLAGIWKNQQEAKNAPDVKARAKEQSEVDAKDEAEKAIKENDVQKIRNQLGE